MGKVAQCVPGQLIWAVACRVRNARIVAASDVGLLTVMERMTGSHEAVIAESAPSESWYPVAQALKMLRPACSDSPHAAVSRLDSCCGGLTARIFLEGPKLASDEALSEKCQPYVGITAAYVECGRDDAFAAS